MPDNHPGASTAQIILYGTSWCPDCRRARRLLDQAGVSYLDIDIEQDPRAAQLVEKLNRGFRSVPTIIFPDGSTLVEPSNAQLSAKLREHAGQQ